MTTHVDLNCCKRKKCIGMVLLSHALTEDDHPCQKLIAIFFPLHYRLMEKYVKKQHKCEQLNANDYTN